MTWGAAPPRTPQQRAFFQAVHDARMARREAARARFDARKKAKAAREALLEGAAARAQREAAEAQERDLAEKRAKEAADLEALQRAQEAHWEATRPRTLSELVEAAMKDEP